MILIRSTYKLYLIAGLNFVAGVSLFNSLIHWDHSGQEKLNNFKITLYKWERLLEYKVLFSEKDRRNFYLLLFSPFERRTLLSKIVLIANRNKIRNRMNFVQAIDVVAAINLSAVWCKCCSI